MLSNSILKKSAVDASLFFRGHVASSRSFSVKVDVSPPIDMLRNVAIIAHVDHGKTTLVDQMLRQGGVKTSGDRLMDSNDLEKERGITIMSKCTRIPLVDGYCLNVVDTPGHADFGGEVERILSMVEGVVLVVDATEGPMPQTKFVLTKALEANLKPIVVINKVDRASSRIFGDVENEIFELFVNLDASEEQLEYPVLYCSAINGWAVDDPNLVASDQEKNIVPLFNAIKKVIPKPKVSREDPFSMMVTSIKTDDYLGRFVTGKVYSGECSMGDPLHLLNRNGEKIGEGKVTSISAQLGLETLKMTKASAGDIVSIAGVTGNVTDTVCDPMVSQSIPTTALDPPTISWTFSVNSSPFSGKEGTQITGTLIQNRLKKESENNVTINVNDTDFTSSESIDVRGRGELQIGILLEQMRREGFELSVSSPRIIDKKDPETGEMLEPYEEVTIETDEEYASGIIDKLQRRGGILEDYVQGDGSRKKSRLVFHISSRNLLGYRSDLISDTRGTALMFSLFHSYQPKPTGNALLLDKGLRKGVLVSMAEGKATSYAMQSIEKNGDMFIHAGDMVYDGMIIGQCTKSDDDMEVNPTKEKKLTNIRAPGKEDIVQLRPAKLITMETALTFIQENEILEITPKSMRIRKRELDSSMRKVAQKKVTQARRSAKENKK